MRHYTSRQTAFVITSQFTLFMTSARRGDALGSVADLKHQHRISVPLIGGFDEGELKAWNRYGITVSNSV